MPHISLLIDTHTHSGTNRYVSQRTVKCCRSSPYDVVLFFQSRPIRYHTHDGHVGYLCPSKISPKVELRLTHLCKHIHIHIKKQGRTSFGVKIERGTQLLTSFLLFFSLFPWLPLGLDLVRLGVQRYTQRDTDTDAHTHNHHANKYQPCPPNGRDTIQRAFPSS